MARWYSDATARENSRDEPQSERQMQKRQATRQNRNDRKRRAAGFRSALAGRLGRRRGAAKLFDHVFEFGDVFKAPVDRGETNVGNGVARAQLVHDEFAETFAARFALAAAQQLIFDTGDG